MGEGIGLDDEVTVREGVVTYTTKSEKALVVAENEGEIMGIVDFEDGLVIDVLVRGMAGITTSSGTSTQASVSGNPSQFK